MFHNLIDNAIRKHERACGGIEFSKRDKDELIELTAIDDGPGMAPQFHGFDHVYDSNWPNAKPLKSGASNGQ